MSEWARTVTGGNRQFIWRECVTCDLHNTGACVLWFHTNGAQCTTDGQRLLSRIGPVFYACYRRTRAYSNYGRCTASLYMRPKIAYNTLRVSPTRIYWVIGHPRAYRQNGGVSYPAAVINFPLNRWWSRLVLRDLQGTPVRPILTCRWTRTCLTLSALASAFWDTLYPSIVVAFVNTDGGVLSKVDYCNIVLAPGGLPKRDSWPTVINVAARLTTEARSCCWKTYTGCVYLNECVLVYSSRHGSEVIQPVAEVTSRCRLRSLIIFICPAGAGNAMYHNYWWQSVCRRWASWLE